MYVCIHKYKNTYDLHIWEFEVDGAQYVERQKRKRQSKEFRVAPASYCAHVLTEGVEYASKVWNLYEREETNGCYT